MYTGIIESVGSLLRINRKGNGASIYVGVPATFNLLQRVNIGDSIATNGVCVTATALEENGFFADVSSETMQLTCYKYYSVGQKLNLELPCTPSTHLGGHIVQGHVDGVGQILKIEKSGEALNVWVQAPYDLMKYIAYKGSIAVNGASLTVNDVEGDSFRLTLIPHTQSVLNFSSFKVGDKVNLEVDVIARYLERLLLAQKEDTPAKKETGLTLSTLMQNGFV